MDYLIYRLFGSKTRTALLTELAMNETQRFHVLELSRRLGIPHSMLIKEIGNLESLGIVNVERIGKLKLVGINTQLPYFKDLKNIITKTSGLKDLIYGRISKVKGVEYCLVFGSFANGEETAESDVDLLVIGSVGTLSLSRMFKELEERIRREINYIVWSTAQLRKRANSKSGFLSDLLSKKVIMVIGSEDGFRRIAEKRPD